MMATASKNNKGRLIINPLSKYALLMACRSMQLQLTRNRWPNTLH